MLIQSEVEKVLSSWHIKKNDAGGCLWNLLNSWRLNKSKTVGKQEVEQFAECSDGHLRRKEDVPKRAPYVKVYEVIQNPPVTKKKVVKACKAATR